MIYYERSFVHGNFEHFWKNQNVTTGAVTFQQKIIAAGFYIYKIWTPSQVYAKDFVYILMKNYKILKP